MSNTEKPKKKVCIIKLGGLGDVLRTTPILRNFQGNNVTWITEKTSFPLLENNIFIQRIFDVSESAGIEGLLFDELYNFDEDEKACILAIDIKAGKKKGYGFKEGSYFPFDSDTEYAYELSKNDGLKFKMNRKTYQQITFEMAGFQWKGEDYCLGYTPKNKVKYRVGINYLVGEKFPNKAWPHWKELSGMLDSVSLQKEFGTLEEYMEWINSCGIIVTGDSLGMHIALALKKKVIVLMGSTSWNEIETYNRAAIMASQLPCAPCYKKNRCVNTPSCMDLITPEMVYSRISKIERTEYERVGSGNFNNNSF